MVRTVPTPGKKARPVMAGMAMTVGVNVATDVLVGLSVSILKVLGPSTQKPIERLATE
jgi:hypothetical protein